MKGWRRRESGRQTSGRLGSSPTHLLHLLYVVVYTPTTTLQHKIFAEWSIHKKIIEFPKYFMQQQTGLLRMFA